MDADIRNINEHQRNYLALVFNQFENRLFLFALKITKSEATAGDIVQEVFLKLWEQKEMLNQIENIESYLFRAVKNKAIDFLRVLANDDKRRASYFITYKYYEDSTQKEIDRKEFNALLEKAIKSLPAQRSLIYQMSQVEGFSRKEIAKKMNISESTVKNQLTSAISGVRSFFRKSLKSLISFF